MYLIYLVAALSVFLHFGSARVPPLRPPTLSTSSSSSSSPPAYSLSGSLPTPSFPIGSISTASLSTGSSPTTSINSFNITSSRYQSSASPSPTATLADFATVLCNSSDVGNPAADPSVRWAEAECDDAWAAVTQNWTTVGGAQSLDFVQYVSEYWNGPQQRDCGKMGEDPCGAGPGDCGDIDDKGPFGTPDTPAGWLILQSFTNFHNVSSFPEMF